MFTDYHVHTYYSDDSVYPMEEVVKDAINKGIEEICFTDHVDYGVKLDHGESGTTFRLQDGLPLRNVNYPAYFKEIAYLTEKYKDQIVIKKGLEFGAQTHTVDKYEKLFNSYPMDFVLLSCHEVNDVEIFMDEYQRVDQVTYNRAYYNEILNTMKVFKNYSSVAHLDSINRYDHNGKLELKYFEDIVLDILKLAIKDKKAIELNMACIRYGVDGLTPEEDILRMYYELGGEMITIGSDSHRKEHLGMYIDMGKERLKKIGFKKFCTFSNMEPIFHDL